MIGARRRPAIKAKYGVSSKAFNYCSQAANSSFGNGSKKASVTVALPRIAPNCTLVRQ